MAGLDPAILLLRLAARMDVETSGAAGGGAAFDDWCGSAKEDGRIKRAPGRVTYGGPTSVE